MQEINLFNIKLSDLELFLNAAKYGSFTKAGEKLFVSQSWVSKRISQFETELGLTLFIRNKREVILTPAGRVLQQRLESTTYDILEAVQAARTAQTGASGSLRLGYLEWGTLVFLNQIREFISSNARYCVEIYSQSFSDLRTSIEEGRLDLIFTASYDCGQFSTEEFNVMNVQKVPIMAYMHASHPLAKRESITMEDLRAEPMLMVDPRSSSGYGTFVRDLFTRHNIRPIIAHYARDGGEHKGNVLIGKGILLASKYFLENCQEEQIARVPVEKEDIYVTAVWRKRNTNPVMSKFLDMIVKNVDL